MTWTSGVGRLWDIVTGRSVTDLAQEVDEALGRLAQAKTCLSQYEEAVAIARSEVLHAQSEVATARDALFAEHPDLAPAGWKPVPTEENDMHPDPTNPALLPGQDPSKFEVVEVDDDNDPRFTAGASTAPSPVDNEPLPPIVWGEHDG